MNALFKSVSVAFLAALASLVFFSPRLLVFTDEAPGSYEWTRGLNFLQQVDGQPLEKVEPALRHRLLPVYVARALGLSGYSSFVMGWLGVICLLAYTYTLLAGLGLPRSVTISTVFLLASTSVVITSLGWLGIFDSWWVLALIVVAFSPKLWLVTAAGLAAPWIDERFLIGLPAAFVIRWLVYPLTVLSAAKLVLFIAITLTPYLGWRVYSLLYSYGDASGQFLTMEFLVWFRMVPHGWWMAYRLAWIFILLPFLLPNASGLRPWQLAGVCLLTAIAAVITAADISRSAMAIAPLLVAGVVLAWRTAPFQTERWIPWVAAANFLVPYIHVVYDKLEPAHPLPLEIVRLIKKVAS
jgi:hypothetical protein